MIKFLKDSTTNKLTLFQKIITKSQTFNELFNINQVEELTKIVSDSTTYPPTESVILRQFENTDTIRNSN